MFGTTNALIFVDEDPSRVSNCEFDTLSSCRFTAMIVAKRFDEQGDSLFPGGNFSSFLPRSVM